MNGEETSAMDEIIAGLWLGDLSAATNESLLREKDIHSVLSVMRGDVGVPRGLRHVHYDLDDVETADVLAIFPRCIGFVESELNKGRRVLVHCHLGMSRSATVVAAYLMYSRKLNAHAALQIIRLARPIVEPNSGFLQQLDVFHEASYIVASSSKVIRLHYLKKGVALPAIIGEEAGLNNGIAQSGALTTSATQKNGERRRRICCKLCRKELASGDDLLEHSKVTNDSLGSMISKACSGYFIEPLPWTQAQSTSGLSAGKLTCPTPRCHAKLGNYDWAGSKCGCGEWVVPGFCLARGKVDECT